MKRVLRAVSILALAALVAGVSASCGNASTAGSRAPRVSILSVSANPAGRAVPSGFLGLSMEYKGLAAYAGTNPAQIDSAFVNVVRNLSPTGAPVLRVGGDSTDWTWWPVPGMARPGGVRFDLTPRYMAVARQVVEMLHGRLILGLNLEANSHRVAATEAAQMLARLGRSNIAALELGNEPELYGSFPWYKTATGRHVLGRPRSYDVQDYLGDFSRVAQGLPAVSLAGPSSGSANWLGSLGAFAARERRVGLITVHAYPLKRCGSSPELRPTQFFQASSLQGLADMIGGWVRTAAAHRLPLRIDEMNSISCGGQADLSSAFAPALWAVDVLPRIVSAGASGVNFHTIPGTWQSLISAADRRSGWHIRVQPEYYGLMMFAEGAPAGSRMMRISGPAAATLDAWATRARSGQIHVVLINKGLSALRVRLKLPVTGPATLTRLLSPDLLALDDATLGGQTISLTTGQLSGTSTATTVAPARGTYALRVPAYSAAMLTTG